MGKIILVLGGARSGKSSFAVNLAKKTAKSALYIATAQAKDKEMAKRIKLHKKNRPSYWKTIEEPLNLLPLLANAPEEKTVLIDCLTLYLSNLLNGRQKDLKKAEEKVTGHIAALIKSIKKQKNRTFIIVSNEVGLGIVPANPLARYFRDIAGRANQILAQNSDQVYFLAAGMPLKIK